MRIIMACFVILLYSLFQLNAQEQIIHFVTDESPPYTINSKNKNELHGFMIDVAREVYNKAGYTIEVTFYSYKRSIQEVISGNADAVLLVAENSAPDLLYLKHPISKDRVVFYAKKGFQWKYTGIESLENIVIASGVGFDFADPELNSYIYDHYDSESSKVQLISGQDINYRNFRKLLMNRVDVVIATEKIGNYIAIKKNIIDKLEIVGASRLFIIAQTGFNPANENSQKYANILSNGVMQLDKSGELNIILKRYGVEKNN